jgi:hypothetical protein
MPRSSDTVLSLAFWGISILLSIMVVLICTPTNSAKSSCYTTSSPEFVVVVALEYGHSIWGEMKSKCGVNCFSRRKALQLGYLSSLIQMWNDFLSLAFLSPPLLCEGISLGAGLPGHV